MTLVWRTFHFTKLSAIPAVVLGGQPDIQLWFPGEWHQIWGGGPGWPWHMDSRTPMGLAAISKGRSSPCFVLRPPPPHPMLVLCTHSALFQRCTRVVCCPVLCKAQERLAASVPTATSVCLPPRFPGSSLHHGLVSLLSWPRVYRLNIGLSEG